MLYIALVFVALLGGFFVSYFIHKRNNLSRQRLQKACDYWVSKPIRKWPREFLEAKRQIQDPLADDVINRLFNSPNANPQHLNVFYDSIQRTSTELPKELPDYIKDYFRNTESLPDWADRDLIKLGEKFYTQHGGIISIVLCAKSLPECYACANGALVLYKTGKLSEQNGSLSAFTRRVAETAQFIVNVMSEGGLSDRGLGIRSAQKVRLIHATIRHYTYKYGWDSEKHGKPINQEDLAGTLMSFAPLVLEGLEKFGVKVSALEKEAYFHCWRIVGHIMGLDEDLLPNNAEDSLKLGYAILEHQIAPSEHGKLLTSSLIDFMTLLSDNDEIHIIVDDLLRLMIGNEMANLLGVPESSDKHIAKTSVFIKKYLGGWENILNRHALLREISLPLNKIFLNGMLRLMNNGEKIHFFIPPKLQKSWDINNNKI